jgi:hypothetical protein
MGHPDPAMPFSKPLALFSVRRRGEQNPGRADECVRGYVISSVAEPESSWANQKARTYVIYPIPACGAIM